MDTNAHGFWLVKQMRGYARIKVTGVIEGFLTGLKFSILGFFWVGKF